MVAYVFQDRAHGQQCYALYMKWVLAFILFVLLVGGTLYLVFVREKPSLVPSYVPSSPEATSTPTFTWSYRTYEDHDIPYTEITLTATYIDGTVERKIIDTIDGSCNTYETTDPDVYSGSTMIICYYAGFGRYYKVIENKGSYLVQRKEFEEASPDYDPPVQSFQTITQF